MYIYMMCDKTPHTISHLIKILIINHFLTLTA